MRNTRQRGISLALGIVTLGGVGALGTLGAASASATPGPGTSLGVVYTTTNSTTGNAVEAFTRTRDGGLVPDGTYPTHGLGTGASGLGQGSVTLSDDGQRLLAVNAGSNQVSEFAVGRRGSLSLLSVVNSGGTEPISVAVHGNLVEVLNAGGSPNVAGFTTSRFGLTPIAGGIQPLGVGASGPEDVTISPDSSHVVVTEKVSNTIDTFAVRRDGRLGPVVTSASDTSLSFASVFTRNGRLLVADDGAAGTSAVSVYRVQSNGSASDTQSAVPDSQTAACWITLGSNGDVFVANAGSGTIGRYRLLANGELAFLGNTSAGVNAKPLDVSVSSDGRDLYVLDGVNDQISTFAVSNGAQLTPVSETQPIPAGSLGIAAS